MLVRKGSIIQASTRNVARQNLPPHSGRTRRHPAPPFATTSPSRHIKPLSLPGVFSCSSGVPAFSHFCDADRRTPAVCPRRRIAIVGDFLLRIQHYGEDLLRGRNLHEDAKMIAVVCFDSGPFHIWCVVRSRGDRSLATASITSSSFTPGMNTIPCQSWIHSSGDRAAPPSFLPAHVP